MKTSEFATDKSALEAWLIATSASLRDRGIYVSYWFHNDGQAGQVGRPLPGFGIVIVDEGSGEFHLMPDGGITRHVELRSKVVLDEFVVPTDMKSFALLFEDFQARVLGNANVEQPPELRD